MLNPYIKEVEHKSGIKKFWMVIAILVIFMIIISVIIFVVRRSPKEICGNNICGEGETQTSCCTDCGCPSGHNCINNKCVEQAASKTCGDNICGSNENCYDCPEDCKCKTGEYCSEIEKKCILQECGNGICEPFENSWNCCDDCSCLNDYEICNKNTHECEIPTIDISDERVKELVEEFYTNQNKTIASMGEITNNMYQEESVKMVQVTISGEEHLTHVAAVNELEEVIEVPFY